MKSLLILTLALVTTPVLAAGNVAAGQEKAAACSGCHGAEGKASVSLYPHLAGQNADYLQHALQAYKKGERSGGQAEVMKAFVSGLSEADMADLAAYYHSIKP
ncbi:c-type cytochrome [Mixta intestinalis]|uniref:Cytochrome c-554(548) n=1 Tax=Mixta intestinalis TaxID=1615494 RepID=A0A6P1PVP3_9GAMM|nr:cytochrome c [Mixta intestinalis]QHM69898.1 Cytochrome c-554(548) [Mixta intestinalis]